MGYGVIQKEIRKLRSRTKSLVGGGAPRIFELIYCGGGASLTWATT